MGILIKNNIVNQKGNPAWYEDTLASRPTANLEGRMFVDTNSPSTGIYRDTGSTWVQIADPGAGTTGTLQQVTTNGSSTTVGISTSGNGIGIGTTIPGSNRLDIHSATGIQATFNGTGTTNSALQLQLAGVGKWNLSNLYNSAANDFIINDVVNSVNRLTVKNTGQTFIGTDTTSSGLFVVNSSTSDNHYVAIGSNAPSYRLRDVGSGGALNCGIGISTAVNNFIQGSASGNFCFFNSSSTASPILFGVYDAGTNNTQEAVRISAARNLLVGTATDGGYKVSIVGTTNITAALTGYTGTFVGGNDDNFIVDNTGQRYTGFYLKNNGATKVAQFYDNTSGIFNIGTVGANAINFLISNAVRAIINGSTHSLTLGSTSGVGVHEFFAGAGTFTGSISIANTVSAAIAAPSTHKVSILINGVQYYLLASNV